MDDQQIESYRQRSESDDHWVLRKEFIKTYWNDFSEERLLCLAQVYSNIELLGCSYPAPVMCQVRELTRNLPEYKELRERRKRRVAVQFVPEKKSANPWDNSGTSSRKRPYLGSISHENKSSPSGISKKMLKTDYSESTSSKKACFQLPTNVSGGFSIKEQFVPPKHSSRDSSTDCENTGMHLKNVLKKPEVITLEGSSEPVVQMDTLSKSSNHDSPTDCKNTGIGSSKNVLQKPEVITVEDSSETVLEMDTLPKVFKDNYNDILQFIKKSLTKQQMGLEILNNISQKFQFIVNYNIESLPKLKSSSVQLYECSVEIGNTYLCKAEASNKKKARSEAGRLAIDLLMRPPKKVKSVGSNLSDKQCVSVNQQSEQDRKFVSGVAKNDKSDNNNNTNANLSTNANLLENQCSQNSSIQKSTTENVCKDSGLPLNHDSSNDCENTIVHSKNVLKKPEVITLEDTTESVVQKSTSTENVCKDSGLPLNRDSSNDCENTGVHSKNVLKKPEVITLEDKSESVFQKNTTTEPHRNTGFPLDSTIQCRQNSVFQKGTTTEAHRDTSSPLDPRTQRSLSSLVQKTVTTESRRCTGISADPRIQCGMNSQFQKNTTAEAHKGTSSPLDPRTRRGSNSLFQKSAMTESWRNTGFPADSRIHCGQNSLFPKNTTTVAHRDTISPLDPRTQRGWNSLFQKNVANESPGNSGLSADPRIQYRQNSLFQKNTTTVAHRDTNSSVDSRTQRGSNSLFQKNATAVTCRNSDFSADPRIQYGQNSLFQRSTTNEAHRASSLPLDPRTRHGWNSLFQNAVTEPCRDTGFSGDPRIQYSQNSLFQKTSRTETYRYASSTLDPRTLADCNSLFQRNATDVNRNSSLLLSSRNSAPLGQEYTTNVNQSRRCTSTRAAFYSSYYPEKQNSSVTGSKEYQMGESCNMDFSSQNPFREFLVILDHSDSNKFATPSSVFINSANFNRVPFQFEYEPFIEKDPIVKTRANIILGGKAFCSGTGENKQTAKEAASEAALHILKKTAYTVKVKDEHDDGFTVSRSQVFGASESTNSVPENSIGCKMLKMMGWCGGGIGKAGNKGIEEPVKAEEKHKFGQGLGYTDKRGSDVSFTARVEQIIQDYARSNSTSDIIFSTEFSKDERKEVHRIATKYGLKNNSKGGKGDGRHCVISRRYSPQELVARLTEAGGRTHKYELLQPTG